LNSIRPNEVRVLYRDEQGFTNSLRASDNPKVVEFMNTGSALGELWIEGHFGVQEVDTSRK
jgi:hypothetical protein